MTATENSVSGLYGLLAMFFAKEMTPELLIRLRNPEFREMCKELQLDFGEEFYSQDSNELVEVLAVEFTGLFIGPGNFISPHESVHHVREDGDYGNLWGADTVNVKKFVEATGLNYQPDFGGMPDHIAAELELMQKLEERYSLALEDNESELAENLLHIKRRFLTEHLLAWAPDFFEKVMTSATIPFYREIAELGKSFIEQEGKVLGQVTEGASI